MRSIYVAHFVLMIVSLGCAISNYPVITDSAGPWGEQRMDSYYDMAYIIPEGSSAVLWADGSDELYTLVSQDWKGDQHLYTYNNFDPTSSLVFLDQKGGYCDPARQTNCVVVKAWNPNLSDAHPIAPTAQSGPPSPFDDPFDYIPDYTCQGSRSFGFGVLISYRTRFGECGSGLWPSPQDLMREFARLEPATFRCRRVYAVPLNKDVAEIRVTSSTGASELMPIYGSYTLYIDEQLRAIVEPQPSIKYQAR
ncbi:MAG: hypothetical protein JSV80_12085 [Acidobacteriota bacterium]|nr:MAG: hypothetical protein JSV80_12085 [Acidobacteriota bacterium]